MNKNTLIYFSPHRSALVVNNLLIICEFVVVSLFVYEKK